VELDEVVEAVRCVGQGAHDTHVRGAAESPQSQNENYIFGDATALLDT